MTAQASLGNELRFQIGSGGSPETFSDMCSEADFGELGEEKTLQDITTRCSGAREYRNGLADGLELPLKLNFFAGNTEAQQLYADYVADTVRTFRLAVGTGSPEEIFQFDATVRAWRLGAPVGEKASVTFTLKISGPVSWAH